MEGREDKGRRNIVDETKPQREEFLIQGLNARDTGHVAHCHRFEGR